MDPRATAVVGLTCLGALIAGCGGADGPGAAASPDSASATPASSPASSPAASASRPTTSRPTTSRPTGPPVEVARAALLPEELLPPAPPSTRSQTHGVETADDDQISPPWGQFMICTQVVGTDEGIASAPEPGAVAAAWSFSTAGSAQVDQYVIVYEDEAAAERAVQRARDQAANCDLAEFDRANDDTAGAIAQVASAPGDGLRVTARFTDQDGSVTDAVSTVLRSGSAVHYMRFHELDVYQEHPTLPLDGLLDPAYTEELIDAAVAHLAPGVAVPS